ncbi:glycosyltransferase family 4 protein [Tamlana sp. 2201CG12-4]|uniref:glycosyltransferase family 4 protein n=1 Tax=Tamlana sp. 2201CG12-4 TaxID=3112582 RepID=UPI002DB71CF3|nr:glycosyltransferase family 4 protein [Tamlana sp. 2201CG12-4]MEC3907349.1 glycosyltransferase family 4 protein [Tamlana sp. 2201CG12-4]
MGLKAKHIAIICNYELLEDRVGGMDHFFWNFNKICNEKQIMIDWFFPNLASHGEYDKFNIIPCPKHLSLEKNFLNHSRANNTQYSHIITHFIELCTYFFAEIKKHQKAKIIAVDHNPRPLKGYTLKKQLKKRLKGILYSKHIDKFIGVSEYTSRAILKDFGSFLKRKIQTVYNGVLIDEIIPKVDERRKINPRFLVVSHLRYSKGIQDLIEAVNILPDFIKNNLVIDVYGAGPYEDVLKAKVNTLLLASVFSFKGSVSNLNEVYCKYDYMLLPSHMECFSLAILESLAANIPVIASNVGGNEEAITHGENGYIFKAKDISALKEIIETVFLGNEQIKINTRTLIKESFSIDTMIKKHIELIRF